jgi:hypothetical protein
MGDVMLEIIGERLHDFRRGLQLLHEEALRTTDALESGIERWGDNWGIRQRIMLRHNLLDQWFRGENLDICLVHIDSTHTMDERCFSHVMDHVIAFETTGGVMSAFGELLSRSVTTLRRIGVERVDLLSQMMVDVMNREVHRHRLAH